MASPQDSLPSCDSDSRRNTLIAPDKDDRVTLDEYKYTVNVGDECIRFDSIVRKMF